VVDSPSGRSMLMWLKYRRGKQGDQKTRSFGIESMIRLRHMKDHNITLAVEGKTAQPN